MSHIYEQIILGAGAAGLFAGAFAKGDFLVLEKESIAGKKLRASGGGRANFSAREISSFYYLSRPEPDFPDYSLDRYGTRDICSRLSRWGLPWEERDGGKLFLKVPAARLAERMTREIGEKLRYNHRVIKIVPGDPHTVETDRGIFKCERLVIASGSPASPSLGGDISVWKILRELGHNVRPPEPALVPLLYAGENVFASLAGISAPVKASWKDSLGQMSEIRGSALFTHRGLSGPAILTASLFAQRPCGLTLDFLPSEDLKTLMDKSEASTFRSLLRKRLPDRLADVLAGDTIGRKNIAELSRKSRNELISRVVAANFRDLAPAGFGDAEVARGGIATNEVNPETFESRLIPRLYIVGEALDVTGSLGGYNLHWAFASAKICQERINASRR